MLSSSSFVAASATVYEEGEDGKRTPYVVQELQPVVEGVIVIAEGGGNAAAKQNDFNMDFRNFTNFSFPGGLALLLTLPFLLL
mgnify:CR=1 FL=1